MSIGREVVVYANDPKWVQAWDIPSSYVYSTGVTDETDHKGQPRFSQYITIHQKRSGLKHRHPRSEGGAVHISFFHTSLEIRRRARRDGPWQDHDLSRRGCICSPSSCMHSIHAQRSCCGNKPPRNLGTETIWSKGRQCTQIYRFRDERRVDGVSVFLLEAERLSDSLVILSLSKKTEVAVKGVKGHPVSW